MILIGVAGLCLFFAGLGNLPLMEPDEGRNAEVAREMLASGDWLTPHYNTFPYLDKPAVYFWMVASAFRLWGLSEWAARLPSAMMALATLLLCWFLAQRMFDQGVARRAGLVFATMPLVIVFARLVIFDMTLTFLVTLALTGFWFVSASDFQKRRWELVFFGAMGLAAITKGPVGFLLPLLIAVAYQAVGGRFRDLGKLRWGRGGLIFLAVALPWFLAVCWQHPDFPRYAFWDESLRRFATGQARRGGNIFYYVPVFFGGFLPWSFFLFFAAWHRFKKLRSLRDPAHRATLFLLVWATVIFLFFSVSRSKLPGYVLPAAVPLAILTAHIWTEVGTEHSERAPDWLTAAFAALMGLGLLLAGAPQVFIFQTVQQRIAAKLHPNVLALLRPSLLYGGLILLALGFLGRNLAARLRGNLLAALTFAVAGLTFPLLLARWIAPLQAHAAASSSQQLARTILASPEKDLPVYGFYFHRTSLTFYLRRPVGLITQDAGELTSNYVSQRWKRLRKPGSVSPQPILTDSKALPEASPWLIPAAELPELINRSTPPLLVLVRHDQTQELLRYVQQPEPLWTDWKYSVWKIPAGQIIAGAKESR